MYLLNQYQHTNTPTTQSIGIISKWNVYIIYIPI